MDNCLVCGAYEGVAVGRPLVLSDNAATRSLFRRGAVYVKSDTDSISRGIGALIEDLPQYKVEIAKLKAELHSEWILQADRFKAQLRDLASPARSQ